MSWKRTSLGIKLSLSMSISPHRRIITSSLNPDKDVECTMLFMMILMVEAVDEGERERERERDEEGETKDRFKEGVAMEHIKTDYGGYSSRGGGGGRGRCWGYQGEYMLYILCPLAPE